MVPKSELPFAVAKLSSVTVESFGQAGLESAIYGDDTLLAITEMMREIMDQVEMGFLGRERCRNCNCGTVHFWRMSLFIS